MFGSATIMLGIGPHSSLLNFYLMTYAAAVDISCAKNMSRNKYKNYCQKMGLNF